MAYDALYDTSQVPGGPEGEWRHPIAYEASWVTARASYQPDLVGEFTARTNSRGDLSDVDELRRRGQGQTRNRLRILVNDLDLLSSDPALFVRRRRGNFS